ncbi:uncharacterized protein LOC132717337, partial [Ruditapes philippinarum]|uniref:uncharacterized protein LOC132717337 n=1 Tax=Ruditapes philippinarum TaxID=129788 RepID=UPI00295A764A
MASGGIAYICVAIVAVCYSVYSCDDNVRLLSGLHLRSPQVRTKPLNGGKEIFLSDAANISGWYSTTLDGWQYIMTDVSNKPHFLQCSTYKPIYLKENHTLINDLGEDPTDIVACVRNGKKQCSTQFTIQVRKCKDEIQYQLKSTAPYSAYCFEKHKLLKRSAMFLAPENVDLGRIYVKPELDFISDQLGFFTQKVPYLKFWCQFNNKEDLFYTVTWYIDEIPLNETMGPSTDMADLVLNEDHLTSRNIPLGIYIRCGVSASIGVNGMFTPMKRSSKFYAGIKITNRNIYLDKASSAVIQMVSTVPIGCRYIIGLGMSTSMTCKSVIKLFVDNDDHLQCERGTILNKVPEETGFQRCTQYIMALAEGDTWDPSTQFNFTIVTSDHNYDDKDKFILKLQFDETMGHTIWRQYFFPEIKVFVQNILAYKSKICRSQNGQHMRTADGYYYMNSVQGTYMLYINKKYNIEVQQIIKQCDFGPLPAKCACAVAISAGQDVFMINRCGIPTFFAFTQCGDGGILDVQKINDNLYRVFTPIGTRISIALNAHAKWMNVDITMAPKDMGNVYGLCGQVDGDMFNDLIHRHSIMSSPQGTNSYNNLPEFVESWRIEENAEENLFRPALRTLAPWVRENGLYCVCNSLYRSNEALCSPTQYLECSKTGSITRTKCRINGRRKRRAGNHSSKEIHRILSKIAVQFSSSKQREEVQEIEITEESKSFCRNKISSIPALTNLTNLGFIDDEDNILQQCEFDFSVMKDTHWANFLVEAFNDGVKNMLDLQPKIVKNNSEKVKAFYANTCPMNCSNHGECIESGICSCLTFYKGSDCSIDERDGLTILDIEGGGECDLADGEACECFYVRSENIQDNFTCSVNTSKILKNGAVEPVSSSSSIGGYEDIFTGICCAPKSIIGNDDVFVAQYTVSISNNGIHFGNAESVYVFDSVCQRISTSESGSKSFSLKDGHCFISGYCYSDNEMAPFGCRACQSSKALYDWTDVNPCHNGGNCVDKTIGYYCMCPPGYRGFNCEYDINECASDPCQNGGTCTDLVANFKCDCVTGY